jgi:hypothetical protein
MYGQNYDTLPEEAREAVTMAWEQAVDDSVRNLALGEYDERFLGIGEERSNESSLLGPWNFNPYTQSSPTGSTSPTSPTGTPVVTSPEALPPVQTEPVVGGATISAPEGPLPSVTADEIIPPQVPEGLTRLPTAEEFEQIRDMLEQVTNDTIPDVTADDDTIPDSGDTTIPDDDTNDTTIPDDDTNDDEIPDSGDTTIPDSGDDDDDDDIPEVEDPPPVPPGPDPEDEEDPTDPGIIPFVTRNDPFYDPYNLPEVTQKDLFEPYVPQLLAPLVLPAENANQDTFKEWLARYIAEGGDVDAVLGLMQQGQFEGLLGTPYRRTGGLI